MCIRDRPHVYAIGDVAGGFQLAHAAYAEGEAAVRHILGGQEEADLAVMPRCIYTMPAFAAVGMGEEKAREEGIQPAAGEFSYVGNGMALAEGAEGLVLSLIHISRNDACGYRPKEEEEEWCSRDPVHTFRKRLIEEGVIGEEELAGIEEEIVAEIEAEVAYAQNSPDPEPESALRDVYWEGGRA